MTITRSYGGGSIFIVGAMMILIFAPFYLLDRYQKINEWSKVTEGKIISIERLPGSGGWRNIEPSTIVILDNGISGSLYGHPIVGLGDYATIEKHKMGYPSYQMCIKGMVDCISMTR